MLRDKDTALYRMKPTIGIITALPEEYTAVKVILDNIKTYSTSSTGSRGPRTYEIGQIPAPSSKVHNIVLCMVGMGNNMAASRTTLLLEDFPNITSIIMVGIAGGAPKPEKVEEHIRLGDVVVSDQNGVVQYDLVKEELDKTTFRPLPRPPSSYLLASVKRMEAASIEGKNRWFEFIDHGLKKLNFSRPPSDTDILVSSSDSNIIVDHPQDNKRKKDQPRVFIGCIASANTLLKNPQKRDILRDKFGVKAFEMESSGVADATWNQEVGFLIIRGICDYCDKLKNDLWHNYAAVVAAAYTRGLLEQTPSRDEVRGTTDSDEETRGQVTYQSVMQICKEQVISQIQYLKGSSTERTKKYIPDLYVVRSEIEKEFEEFLGQQEKNACVIVGEAGIGKTNLLCHLSEKLIESRPVFFLNSMYIKGPIENALIDLFNREEYPNFTNLMDELNEVLNEKNIDLIVFVDAINEAPDPVTLKKDLGNLVQNSIGKRVKFYISCRDMDWEFFLKNNDLFIDRLYSKKGRVFIRNDLRFNQFTPKEFNEAWTRYKRVYRLKGTLEKGLKEICLHPLMLRFLAEGFEGETLPNDVRRIEIFDQYWSRKLVHTGSQDKATQYMFKFVSELKKNHRNDLPKSQINTLLCDTTDDLQTVLSKILSENLVTYLNWSGDRVVGFAYEAFFEYVMARWIIYGSDYSWLDKEENKIINDLNIFAKEAKQFRIMKGTIQYLVMMMEGKKSDIQVVLLNELLKSDDPAWESFVINVSLKLRDQIRLVDIIGKLALHGNFKAFAASALGEIGGENSTEYLIKTPRS